MAVGIALPFSPLASYLQLQALPLSYFPWLVAIPAGYMVLTRGREGLLQPPLRLAVRDAFSDDPRKKAATGCLFHADESDQRRTAMASISIFTSFGRRATSTQERAGKVALCSVKNAS